MFTTFPAQFSHPFFGLKKKQLQNSIAPVQKAAKPEFTSLYPGRGRRWGLPRITPNALPGKNID
jgi:hypothetical protein